MSAEQSDVTAEAEQVLRDEVEQRLERAVKEWDEDDVPAVVAAKLRAELEETCPDDLNLWLAMHAEDVLTREIRRRVAKTTGVRGRSREAAFQSALVIAESRELDALASFECTHTVGDEEKSVADMTGDDHLQVATRYQAAASTDVMLAAFHRAIAKALGERRTADVMDERQYARNLRDFAQRMCGA